MDEKAQHADQDQMLRYPGASAHTGIGVPTLQTYVCRKQIPHYRLGKRLVVFSKTELTAWMAQRHVSGR